MCAHGGGFVVNFTRVHHVWKQDCKTDRAQGPQRIFYGAVSSVVFALRSIVARRVQDGSLFPQSPLYCLNLCFILIELEKQHLKGGGNITTVEHERVDAYAGA